MAQRFGFIAMCISLSASAALARAPRHAPGMYALRVDERGEQDDEEEPRNFTLTLSIADYDQRRALAGGTLRFAFVALGESYVIVLRGRHAQLNYLDGYTAPATFMVSYPSDLRTATMYRGTLLDIDETQADADGMLQVVIDVSLMRAGE